MTRTYTISDALREMTQDLKAAAGDEAALTARLLMLHALGEPDGALGARLNAPLDPATIDILSILTARRMAGEPTQYILGEWEFMGLPFYVGAGALIPRQDTETLCETALPLIKERGYKTHLDLCCGTGCIGVSLARLGGVRVTFADASTLCIDYAKRNTERHGIEGKFLLGDLFAPVTGKFDIITANPPYLTFLELRNRDIELTFEPVMALYGGEDGLDCYRRIADEYKEYLNPGGALLLECGSGQSQKVMELFPGSRAVKDILGIERVIVV